MLLQLRLAVKSGNTLKEREYHWRSAEAFDRLGEFTDAEEQLKALQDMELTKEQYLETLCQLADIQVWVQYCTTATCILKVQLLHQDCQLHKLS